MFNRKGAWILALGIILMVVGSNVDAQQTVYKWVDKDGVVHFSDEPPVESKAVKIETITTAKPRPMNLPLSLPSNCVRLLKSQLKNDQLSRNPTHLLQSSK
jgi:hypothetical protein